MQLSIRSKYTLFIIGLVAFVVISLLALTHTQNRKFSASYMQSSSQVMSQALMVGMEQRGNVITQLLTENLVNPLYIYDLNAIEKLIRGYKSYSNVIDICVYDAEGKLIHDGTDNVDRYGALVEDRQQVRIALSSRKPASQIRQGRIEFYRPVTLEENVLGGVKVILSLSEIQAQTLKMQAELTSLGDARRRAGYTQLLIVFIGMLALGAFLSYILALRISIPISKMARYAAQVGKGNYGNRLDYATNDEIGELAAAFNNMQRDLMSSTVSINELERQVDLRTHELASLNEDLKAHQEQLEAKVAERTSELVRANKSLTREIEERKSIEEKLVRAKKIEAIGTLAAAVAHDLNNILTGMVGIPDLILLNLEKDDPLREDILKIKKSGLRAAAVVQDLLNLARKNIVANKALDLGTVVQDYLKSTEHRETLKYCAGVKVETDIPPETYSVLGSQIHLSKALMNLISNAAESMPGGGHIAISLKNVSIDPSVEKYRDFAQGEYVALQVQDTGDGISAENLGRIFEPFYTTKAMGRSGSGLGMTVVWETVKDHNGHMEVQSTVGKGTAFTLYFPRIEQASPIRQEERPSDNYHGKGESVLIVDDLESQRNLLKSIMNRLGYKAQTLPSGEAALEHLKDNAADLVILDMMMAPGMDGLDTYREILKLQPRQKAIVVSGYSDTDRTRQMQALGAGAYIRKPYTMKQIGKAVRAELDR